MSTLRAAISLSDVSTDDSTHVSTFDRATPRCIDRGHHDRARVVLAGVHGVLAGVALFSPVAVLAADAGPLRNWFDDPFFQVRNAAPECPVPLGPLTTGEEMQTQAHNRSERGTRCWHERRCSRPNSFLYDKDIAEGVRSRFAGSRDYRDSTLWVTVQRRIVWIEGCVRPGYAYGRLEKFVKDVPDVELVVVNVRKRPQDPVPYRRLEGGHAPPDRPVRHDERPARR